MDLTLVYTFIVAIMAVCSCGLVSVDDRNIRRVLLVVMLSTIGVGIYMEQIKAEYDLRKANEQIIALAKCQGTGQVCSWSAK